MQDARWRPGRQQLLQRLLYIFCTCTDDPISLYTVSMLALSIVCFRAYTNRPPRSHGFDKA